MKKAPIFRQVIMRIKRTREQGSINAADGGVIYVLMDEMQQVKTCS